MLCLCAQADENGLTDEEVKRRIEQYGLNKLPESTRIPFLVRWPVAAQNTVAVAQPGDSLASALMAASSSAPYACHSIAQLACWCWGCLWERGAVSVSLHMSWSRSPRVVVAALPAQVFLGYLWNPLSWAMEAAAILAIILLDYADFVLIVALLLVNATIRCHAVAMLPCPCTAAACQEHDHMHQTSAQWQSHDVCHE